MKKRLLESRIANRHVCACRARCAHRKAAVRGGAPETLPTAPRDSHVGLRHEPASANADDSLLQPHPPPQACCRPEFRRLCCILGWWKMAEAQAEKEVALAAKANASGNEARAAARRVEAAAEWIGGRWVARAA